MVRIRLRRVGAKKQPSYRIVVADQRSPRDGRFIETIGHFNPRTQPETVNYDEERALHWLSVGAQPTEAVQRLFNNGGTYGRLERLRGGEAIDALVEEALAEAEQRTPVSPKTRHAPGVSSKKKQKATEEAVAEAEEETADAEAVAEVTEEEESAEETPEAVEEEATDTEAAEEAADEEAEEPEAAAEESSEEPDDAEAEESE